MLISFCGTHIQGVLLECKGGSCCLHPKSSLCAALLLPVVALLQTKL